MQENVLSHITQPARQARGLTKVRARETKARARARETKARAREKGTRAREKGNQVGIPTTHNGRVSIQEIGFNKVNGKSGHLKIMVRVLAKVSVKVLAKREL